MTEQQRSGVVEYNFGPRDVTPVLEAGEEGPVAEMAAKCGVDAATYAREAPGMSAFALEDGAVYHTYWRMRAAWMLSGPCTSGSTGRRRVGTRPRRGSDVATSTIPRNSSADLPRSAHARSVHIHRDGLRDRLGGYDTCFAERSTWGSWRM
jgi:hypothetical protein